MKHISESENKYLESSTNTSDLEQVNSSSKYMTNSLSMNRSNLNQLRNWILENQERTKGSIVKCPLCYDTGFYLLPLGIEKTTKDGKIIIYQESLTRIMCDCDREQDFNKTLDNFLTKSDWQQNMKDKAQALVKAYQDSKYWFYISGQVGCGKTHIIKALGFELNKKYGVETVFVDYLTEWSTIKADVNTKGYMDKIDYFKRVKVLIIDDLFKSGNKEKPTAADSKVALMILNYRYEKNLITIISSEFSMAELMDFDAAYSRIYEKSDKGRFILHISDDPSRNQRVGKQ